MRPEAQPDSISSLKQKLTSWLEKRQSMLISLNHLCSFRPFDQPHEKDNLEQAILSLRCELVDYCSMGQFEIYQILFQALEKEPHNDPLMNKRFVSILSKTTLYAMDFYDKYQTVSKLDCLESDLSFLSERLSHRMEIEDKLISLINFP